MIDAGKNDRNARGRSFHPPAFDISTSGGIVSTSDINDQTITPSCRALRAVAASRPALRAARIDPIATLRED
jgi:hypothetical protein